MRYMFAPTCCYQLVYPMQKGIRLGFLFKRGLELLICNLLIVFLYHQHMVPIARDSVQPLKDRNYLEIALQVLEMSVPAAYLWICFAYMFFHSWMNLSAELTKFSDRRFYSDWWNAGNLGEYWRKWNYPIHNFLHRHIYLPLRRRNIQKYTAAFYTFLFSALLHEYMIIGIFRVCNFVAFSLMLVNLPLMIIQDKFKGFISPNANNWLFWLFYLVIGQPFGIILCYYQYNK